MKEIELTWYGPVDFSKIKEKDYTDTFKGITEGGIYLHCFQIPNSEKYAISYVGKHEYSIVQRNIEHYFNTKNGNYSIYSLSEETFLNIIYNQNDSSKIENFRSDIIKNINMLKLFYAKCKAKEISEFVTLRPLEGALQYYLYRNTNTRKYLTTNVSNYDLRNVKICNVKGKLNTNYEIIGLDDNILTYMD
ncbi:MAG: hypothetical protein JST15_11090 [Bacteroidetes bacterium]|nr:hypothetical protein [Bacteroidota bacterium]